MENAKRNIASDCPKGFTLIELIVVMAMIVIILAIATPAFIQWRQNLQYKEAADGIVSILRKTRSNAISANCQQRVECNPTPANQYRITQGDKSYQSTNWTTVIQNWITLPTGVVMSNGVNIQFSPNGTATPGAITIGNATSNIYQITVSATGRIQNIRQ